ncbi:MAG: lysophospholipid acyltransferase family protein [Ketobacteraceae bacterium]|nr:lysophospholipid acyltransferase family protein [Ketobacteraceae bacterium]
MTLHSNDVLDFTPPPLETVEKALKLQKAYFDPVFFGMSNVDKNKPALYVSNHTIYGNLDGPLIYLALYEEKDIVLRSLGDHFHFQIPGWRTLLQNAGTVEGTPENCHRLMEAGEHILVYPGGGREVAKRKGEQYKLAWKTRTGFARMAMEHGYPIIPVASLGADDAYDIHYDAYDFKASKIGQKLLENKTINRLLRNGDVVFPLSTGLAFTPLPRPERFYFSFGEPIETAPFQDQAHDKETQWKVRKQVMESLEAELDHLKTIRYKDRDMGFLRKMFSRH